MRKLVATGAVLIVTGVGVTASWASTGHGPSAANGPLVETSSLSGQPGDTLTVAGEGCDPDERGTGDWSAHVWLIPAPGTVEWEPAFGHPVAIVAPDDDGRWSTEVTVPEFHTEYRLEAACFDEAPKSAGFLYRHEVFTVD
jgi:hypothetical protein